MLSLRVSRIRLAVRQFSSPSAIDYDSFITPLAKRRPPSAIRSLEPLMSIPGMISLGGGLPNPAAFPISGFTIKLKEGEPIELTPSQVVAALQYSSTRGYGELLEWLKRHQIETHSPKYTGWDTIVTVGSQDGLARAFDTLLDQNTSLLLEDPTYSGALAPLRPLQCNLVPVPTDGGGIIPSAMAQILDNWNSPKAKPRVLYTIPTGQNPSGATLNNARRTELYQIARKHNLLILEDDPYWYLQLDNKPGQDRIRSLFSMDSDGRVLRFDSFSKVLSSGLRMGWVTGPAPIIDKIQLSMQASILHNSTLSQIVTLALLNRWGTEGFQKHILSVQAFYRNRRDICVEYAEKHLKGLAEWTTPSAGMFLWLKLLGVEDSQELIQKRALEKKVLMVPGQAFSPLQRPSPFVRASYSTASPEHMDEAFSRLAQILKEK
eukprot:GILJ01002012.1.p1 GENE.GILJ01002012.1~~GILJ01002012.1.p1  ORF type:complete len:434 (-),score=58.33 GILJ01002012.1:163-1464(-)